MTTADKVKEVVAKQLNRPIEDITDDKDIVADLGADSLDVVEMIMNLDDEYGITISDEDAVNIKTVADIVKVIDERK